MLLFFFTQPFFRGKVEICRQRFVNMTYLKTRKNSSEISWPLVQLIKAIHSWTLCAYNLVFKTVVCVLRTYLYLKCFTYLEDRWKKIRSNSWCDCIPSAMTWGYALLQRRFEALVIFGWSLMTENATTSALKMG